MLGSFVYWTARSALVRQIEDRITTEQAYLLQEYDSGGIAYLENLIRFRQRNPANDMVYRLTPPDGGNAIGNLPEAPQTNGWIDVPDLAAAQVGTSDRTDEPQVYRVLADVLSNGAQLSVGHSLGPVDDVSEAILTAFAFGSIGVFVFGIGGGLVLSAAFLRRVDAITRTAEAIIAGDMRRRIPLRGTSDDFDRLAATLNAMLDRIGALMESLRQVSSDIAHDLRTPLSRLRLRLETAQENARSTDEYRWQIEAAIRETDGILDTFGALLRIAQVEAGTRRAGFKPVDLSALFLAIADAYAPVVEDAGKVLDLAIEPGFHGHGDRDLLMQMLANLVENAIRHSGVGNRVAIGLAHRAGEIVGWVSDDGIGVPASEREHIFHRFYRVEASRTSPGNGLGLAMVAAVADLHGIRIDLRDNHPGLRVDLILPKEGPESGPN
jgi:signal transduction histidine kinase